MVRLDRIYTGAGDSGKTSLGDGSRVEKTCQRLVVMGAVDELNAQLGLAIAGTDDSAQSSLLEGLQQMLFDLGADLCTPLPTDGEDSFPSRIGEQHLCRLEQYLEAANRSLSPLNSFVLPGGTPTAAVLHVARTVCRRAELEFCHLRQSDEPVPNPWVGVVLNRLSDLLFVLARQANHNGSSDVLWVPGTEEQNDESPETSS